ncbi:MAG: HEAT repeat domain-containing protein [Cellulosilyticaceae bacterium]
MSNIMVFILPILIIVLILLSVVICLCIYFVYNNYKNKKIHQKLIIIKKQVQDDALELINNLDKIQLNEETLYQIKKYLNSKNYQKETINFLLELPNRKDVINLVKETNLLDAVFKNKDKDELDKAYKIHIIGEFLLDEHMDYLMESCEDEHMYIQINTLKALARLGNVKYFLEYSTKIINSLSLIHDKIIIDAIYSFEGNNEELNKQLSIWLNDETSENEKLKIIILNHFINIKYEDVKKDIYNILIDEKYSKELKLVGIKYFIKIKYPKVQIVLLKLLNDESWEIRAIAASALKNYKYKEVISNLKQSIKDSGWYVRQNSARSLIHLVDNKDDLTYIINGEDKYASDSMISILSEENRIEEFLFDINMSDILDIFKEEEMVKSV